MQLAVVPRTTIAAAISRCASPVETLFGTATRVYVAPPAEAIHVLGRACYGGVEREGATGAGVGMGGKRNDARTERLLLKVGGAFG
jgi:hypothetical protein